MSNIPAFPTLPVEPPIVVEPEPKPVISPFVALLKSRKFIVGVIGIIFNFLVTKIPDLALYQTELMTAITGVAVSIILGIAYEDGKAVAVEALPGQLSTPTEAVLKDLLGDVIDTVLKHPDGSTEVTFKPGVKLTPFE